MGLDMYLNGTRYLWVNGKDNDKVISKKIGKLFNKIKDFSVKQVEIEVGYWRKSNAIHKWFVENVQDGEDDCGKYYVGKKQLEKLKEICEEILKDKKKAKELLPAQSGFFFGNTDYDEFYFDDLKHTIKTIKKALELPEEWDFEYRSSW